MPQDLILALDQGTTSTRCIAFRAPTLAPVATARRDLPQHFPDSGWVEHDPEDLFQHSLEVLREAMALAGATPAEIAGIGITNQRETTLVWHRDTGKPIHRAIVWQDRRTAPLCAALREAGHEAAVSASTGLLLDPYFSATKLAWLLDNVPGARADAEAGRLAFGTVDTWLLWRLTEGRVHATDATNASRTMLYDIRAGAWDPAMLALFRIPASLLPEVRDCAGRFGTTTALGGEVAIAGIAGDQQAAAIGQACFEPGMVKSTYGTGCFVLMNTGEKFLRSRNRLLSTVAARLSGRTTYALEGSIFVSGAAVQWLRDALRIIQAAPDTEALARSLAGNDGVYMVPAFVGLGAPWWDPDARGAILGLTRDSGIAHIARAALESCVYQTEDLMGAMRGDGMEEIQAIRVDGGMAVNDWFAQFLADQLGLPVERPAVTETTALGAACLAGLGTGVYGSTADIAARWRRERRFEPVDDAAARAARHAGWRDAVGRVLTRG
jgi:glycerol kinase